MTRIYWFAFGGLSASALLLAAGCAHSPPKELVDARSAYERASQGPAAQYNPTELYQASQALEHANRLYESDPGSDYTRDVAYIALRKAELAEVDGRVDQANRQRAEAQRRYDQLAQSQLAQSREDLNKTKEQLAAEQRAREDALNSLSKIAKVRQESRGTVITLSGSILFASGKSTLLPDARSKLDQVADVLKSAQEQSYIVEGHADSRGSTPLNQRLSEQRAETVRNYLVERGISPDRVKSTGYGKSRPIANNKTAEGRANNRRVEIVVQREHSPDKG
jgi:outer membrane protein OmpA-like peptidoglycan-associated protein